MKYDLVELCCGLGAVTWAAVGAPPPPVSRIGSKRGYTGPILSALGIEPGTARNVLMVDSDRMLCHTLKCLTRAAQRDEIAYTIERNLRHGARRSWERARALVKAGHADAYEWLLWTAGARGGVGGFKGAHKLRPNVDGFIPSRKSLAARLRRFALPPGVDVEISCCDVENVDPRFFKPTVAYCDPPYLGRTGYECERGLCGVCDGLAARIGLLARNWQKAGHRVIVSLPLALPEASRSIEITHLRRGQTRRSMTKDSVEWLSVFEP